MPADFHFLHPEWFLTLIPLGAILWAAARQGAAHNAWQRVVDAHLLPYLLVERAGSARWLPLALAATGWIAAVTALANPTYERRPVPALRPVDARVVVLDLSRSMEAADLKPSRLARARYKVADILNRSRDGQVGLIAFAGDAFVVAPLSNDADTLLGMLDALSPEVMPIRGSRPDLGLAKAGELLTQAGAREGEVILVGDDAGDDRALAAAADLSARGRTVSVIGVGTGAGAPVPGARDPDGKPVMARLDVTALEELARAGGGAYATLTPDAADLDLVLHRQAGQTGAGPGMGQGPAAAEAQQWEGLGPWVTLALLPLAALAFRRGWLMGAALSLILSQGVLTPRPALAITWDDLWQRPDQQAAAALAQGDPQRALDLAAEPDQRGTASYRLGDYQSAADAFAAAGDADSDYNRGNALALSGRLEEAIAAYDEALRRQPGMDDALYNKARVEELLKQQQEQQKQQEQQQQSGSGEGSQDQSGQPPQGEQDQTVATGQQPQGERGDPQDQSQTGQPEDQQGQSGQAKNEPKDESQDGQGADSGSGEQQPEGGSQGQAAGQQGAGQDQPHAPQQVPQQGQQAQSGAAPAPGQDAPPAKDAEARRAQAEQAAQDYSAAAAREAQAGQGEPEGEQPGSPAEADLPPEEREARQAMDQWLRRIPDDPAGLLRRKFLYQHRQRNQQGGATTSGDPW